MTYASVSGPSRAVQRRACLGRHDARLREARRAEHVVLRVVRHDRNRVRILEQEAQALDRRVRLDARPRRPGLQDRELRGPQVETGAREQHGDHALAVHPRRETARERLSARVQLGVGQSLSRFASPSWGHFERGGARRAARLVLEDGVQQADTCRGPLVRVHMVAAPAMDMG